MRIPFAIVITLTLFSGIVHGMIDGRWLRSEDLIARGSKLQQAPEQCGDWTLVETRELEENARDILRCYGSEVRVYRYGTSSTKVTVAVFFGPRGPIAVHTPEVCYDSIGTDQTGPRKKEIVAEQGTKNSLWSVEFAKRPSPDPAFEVWYAWSSGGEWIAAENPRFWMTNNLYKIQISGPIGDGNFRPCEDFLDEFLPALQTLIQ